MRAEFTVLSHNNWILFFQQKWQPPRWRLTWLILGSITAVHFEWLYHTSAMAILHWSTSYDFHACGLAIFRSQTVTSDSWTIFVYVLCSESHRIQLFHRVVSIFIHKCMRISTMTRRMWLDQSELFYIRQQSEVGIFYDGPTLLWNGEHRRHCMGDFTQ